MIFSNHSSLSLSPVYPWPTLSHSFSLCLSFLTVTWDLRAQSSLGLFPLIWRIRLPCTISLSLSVSFSICIFLYFYFSLSLSFSLSLPLSLSHASFWSFNLSFLLLIQFLSNVFLSHSISLIFGVSIFKTSFSFFLLIRVEPDDDPDPDVGVGVGDNEREVDPLPSTKGPSLNFSIGMKSQLVNPKMVVDKFFCIITKILLDVHS